MAKKKEDVKKKVTEPVLKEPREVTVERELEKESERLRALRTQ